MIALIQQITMKNVTSEIQNVIAKINWEVLEMCWANQYEEDYVTSQPSNFENPSFLSLNFPKQFGKRQLSVNF